MVEKLWYHALQFLDAYRLSADHSNCHFMDLYKFTDNTGILEIHKKLLSQPFMDNEVDMKILYYELIRMLTNYEREHCRDEDLYEYTRSITKIEGYQDLTNRLQRFLNHRFMLDIDELNKKYVGVGENNFIPSESQNNDKLDQLEAKLDQILEDNSKLKNVVSSLSSTNQALEKEILELKQRFESVENKSSVNHKANSDAEEQKVVFSKSECFCSELSDKINVQNEDIAKVNDKMQSMISQANTLLINDATHLERIFNLETQVSEINGKLLNLEAADLYLQEAHKVLTERTSLIEKYSKYIEEKVKLVSSNPVSPTTKIDTSSCKYEELDRRISCLEKVKSNQNINENYIQRKNIITEEIKNVSNISNEENSYTKINMNNSDLYDKYKVILSKILKMEELLSQQAQTISDYSELFSDKYFKLLALNNNKTNQTEITKLVSEKLSEIMKEEFSSYSKITTESTKFHGPSRGDHHILDFIEILVGMNKSMNQMMEDYVSSQIQLKTLKTEQKIILGQIQDNNELIQSQRREFIELTDEYDKAHLKKLCDFDKVNQKTHKLEENLKFLKGRISELERQRKTNTTPSIAVEEDFSIDVNDKG